MSFIEGRNSNIDLPASPYTLLGVDADGVIHTPHGSLTMAAIESLLARRIDAWMAHTSGNPQEPATGEIYESMIDVLSLLAEIDLDRARTLWTRNTAIDAGTPRLLARASESQEVRYASNLAVQRSLDADELALHILEEAEFMGEWAQARRQLIAATPGEG